MRALRHPFDLGWALTVRSLVFDHLGEPEEQLKRAEEAERLGREASMPLLAVILAPLMTGIALTRKRRFADGIALARPALAAWEGVGGRLASPYVKSVLAEAMAQLGNIDDALDLINDAIAQIERPGWEERHYYAEALRTRGCLLLLKGDMAGAERNYIASLDWARQQQAKSWELRAAMGMARLWRDQGKRAEARDLLAPVYGWFTEGFDTPDLKEAKALLRELA
jgi:predicted ATPase